MLRCPTSNYFSILARYFMHRIRWDTFDTADNANSGVKVAATLNPTARRLEPEAGHTQRPPSSSSSVLRRLVESAPETGRSLLLY